LHTRDGNKKQPSFPLSTRLRTASCLTQPDTSLTPAGWTLVRRMSQRKFYALQQRHEHNAGVDKKIIICWERERERESTVLAVGRLSMDWMTQIRFPLRADRFCGLLRPPALRV
jgi:hypothetical protein